MVKTFTRIEARNKKALHTVSPELCKGCGLCIEKCPSHVLDWSEQMGIYGTPITEAKRMERCTACMLCQYFCPDAAIDVIREKKEKDG